MPKDYPKVPEKTFGRPDNPAIAEDRSSVGRRRPKKRPPAPRFMIAIATVIVLIGLVVIALNYFQNQQLGPKEASEVPEVLSGIGLDGAGGDPLLNRLKNRTVAPKEKNLKDFSVAQIIAIPHDILSQEGKRHRNKWYPSSRLEAEKYESIGARVTGYILRAKQSGLESANGYVDSLRDYHIWISDSPDGQRNNSIVVEVTPRWKIAHPEWRLRYFKKLADQQARVRVTGWILWDHEHASEVEKSRGSQWEIHPITKFEVWNNGAWQELQDEPPV